MVDIALAITEKVLQLQEKRKNMKPIEPEKIEIRHVEEEEQQPDPDPPVTEEEVAEEEVAEEGGSNGCYLDLLLIDSC